MQIWGGGWQKRKGSSGCVRYEGSISRESGKKGADREGGRSLSLSERRQAAEGTFFLLRTFAMAGEKGERGRRRRKKRCFACFSPYTFPVHTTTPFSFSDSRLLFSFSFHSTGRKGKGGFLTAAAGDAAVALRGQGGRRGRRVWPKNRSANLSTFAARWISRNPIFICSIYEARRRQRSLRNFYCRYVLRCTLEKCGAREMGASSLVGHPKNTGHNNIFKKTYVW